MFYSNSEVLKFGKLVFEFSESRKTRTFSEFCTCECSKFPGEYSRQNSKKKFVRIFPGFTSFQKLELSTSHLPATLCIPDFSTVSIFNISAKTQLSLPAVSHPVIEDWLSIEFSSNPLPNTYIACFLSLASRALASECRFKIIDVLFMYSIGTAGTACNFTCRSVSCVAMIYLKQKQQHFV